MQNSAETDNLLKLVNPHGCEQLKPLLLAGDKACLELEKTKQLTKINLSSREVGDIIMMGIGGFTPLDGFMNKSDWQGICDTMTMSNGLFWPIPITLSVSKEKASSIAEGDEVVLVNKENDEIMATMLVTEKYTIDKIHECKEVYKTIDEKHPGVKMVMAQGDVNLAGPVKVLSQGVFPNWYGDLYMTPEQTRTYFVSKGWQTITAFQTRNPMHRAHEYLVKVALEVSDGVLIHSLLGKLKSGDIPAKVRSQAIIKLIETYFVKGTILQSGYPLDMRYAGPREALLHALFRQNYGCSHLIVGRDHAGVGDYYGPFDAHHIFDEIPKNALETKALKINWTFWCFKCDSMASMKTCPHQGEDRLLLSGTKLRQMLSENLEIPEHFSRPEVLTILRKYYGSLKESENSKVESSGHSAK